MNEVLIPAAYDVGKFAGKFVIKKLIEELGHIVYCRIEAQKLSDLLRRWVGTGDISTRILSLPPSLQTEFEVDFWGFLDAVEDARDVTKSALQLRWYQLPGRYQHSHQLRSIRERLQKFVEKGFSDRLEAAAKEAVQAACATIETPTTSNGQQGNGDVEDIFQQTETFIPHLKAQLTNAGGKRNLALCGMPGSGKTTVARRVYEELKGGYDKHHFMTVSQTPNLFQLLKSAGKELFGMREFDFKGKTSRTQGPSDERAPQGRRKEGAPGAG
jgi:hypothetical protein